MDVIEYARIAYQNTTNRWSKRRNFGSRFTFLCLFLLSQQKWKGICSHSNRHKNIIVQTKITDNLLSSCFAIVHRNSDRCLFLIFISFRIGSRCNVQSHTPIPPPKRKLSHRSTEESTLFTISNGFSFVPFGMVHFICIITFNGATTAIWHAICCMLSTDSKFKTALELNGKLYAHFRKKKNFK